MSRILPAVIGGCLCLCTSHALGQTVLTFDGVLDRARTQSGASAVARARVAEAETALLDVSARFRQNPLFEAAAGPRISESGNTGDFDVSVSQALNPAGWKRARTDQATAAIERRRAEADASAQTAVHEAAGTFIRAIAATEQLRIAEQAAQIDRELLAATERRFNAGDVSAIDMNLARLAAARSVAEAQSAGAVVTATLGRLRSLLRMPADEAIRVDGSLDRPPLPPLAQLEALLSQRPEVAALESDVREASALTRLGVAAGRPEFGVRAAFEREDRDSIVLGGITIGLPMFQRGLSQRAAGAAASTRAKLELDVLRASMLADLRTAYAVHEQRRAAAAAFSAAALPVAADNEALAQRSYDAGELNLPDLLQIRRSAVDMRMSAVEQQLAAALDRLDVDRIAGVLR
jgi:cobalt-zinc-cadmium efflux system outer membrane protein